MRVSKEHCVLLGQEILVGVIDSLGISIVQRLLELTNQLLDLRFKSNLTQDSHSPRETVRSVMTASTNWLTLEEFVST